MNFKGVKSITVPEGTVKKITCNGVVLWESALLPSIYQQVAYIKAADTIGAYLDLGIRFDTSARFLIGMYVEEASTAYIFGAAERSGAIRCMLTAPYVDNSANAMLYGTATGYIHATTSIEEGLNEFEGILKKGQLTLTNQTYHVSRTLTTQSEYAMSSNLYLLGQNYNGSPRFGGTRRVSYFKYYDKTDTLICDLVPCYRKADGVIGMYDIVRKLFLTNVGSGTFTKGADV